MALLQLRGRGCPAALCGQASTIAASLRRIDWPNISSQYGIIDTCGFPKDTFFYYQSWWTEKPVLHLFPHWNWPGMEGKEIAVWVYSNLDKVELFLNGQSLGAKEMKKDSHVAWNVKYAPGAIEARGFKDGKQVMTAKRETTGARGKAGDDARIGREVSADGEDVAMFAVEVQDAQGRVVPITDNEVTFKVSGAGKLIGVGNGDPTDQESGQGHVAQGLLRPVHGDRAGDEDARERSRWKRRLLDSLQRR